jgi:acetyl esterase/lipase
MMGARKIGVLNWWSDSNDTGGCLIIFLARRPRLAGALLLCASLALHAADQAPANLMTPQQLQALPAQPADHRVNYGSDSEQFAELRVPQTVGPHPVVVLIHGGCWKADYANLSDLSPLGDALKAAGFASWNIEYRRLHQAGGGWPGTYRDVAQAIDHLRNIAKDYALDLNRVVVVGHSAGGHLAHWAAARHRLAGSSEVYVAQPLLLHGVINMAGTMDMRANIGNMETLCNDGVVSAMHGGSLTAMPQRYEQSSAYPLLPLGVPQLLLWGQYEPNVPLPLAQDFRDKAQAAGDQVQLTVVPGIGHFELASPSSAAWPVLLESIQQMLRQ